MRNPLIYCFWYTNSCSKFWEKWINVRILIKFKLPKVVVCRLHRQRTTRFLSREQFPRYINCVKMYNKTRFEDLFHKNLPLLLSCLKISSIILMYTIESFHHSLRRSSFPRYMSCFKMCNKPRFWRFSLLKNRLLYLTCLRKFPS